jgi:hypothetical protein
MLKPPWMARAASVSGKQEGWLGGRISTEVPTSANAVRYGAMRKLTDCPGRFTSDTDSFRR